MEAEDGIAQGGEQQNLALLADVGAQQKEQPMAGKRKRGETEGERVRFDKLLEACNLKAMIRKASPLCRQVAREAAEAAERQHIAEDLRVRQAQVPKKKVGRPAKRKPAPPTQVLPTDAASMAVPLSSLLGTRTT